MGEPTVLASLADTVLRAAASADLHVTHLVEEAELQELSFDDPEQRIPFRLYGQLWESILRRVADAPFGLRVAERHETGTVTQLPPRMIRTGPVRMNGSATGSAV